MDLYDWQWKDFALDLSFTFVHSVLKFCSEPIPSWPCWLSPFAKRYPFESVINEWSHEKLFEQGASSSGSDSP